MKRTKTGIVTSIVSAVLLVGVVGRCDAFQYEAKGKRDPFVPLVGMDKPAVARLEDVSSVDDIRLEGIASGAKGAMVAMMNGEQLKVGDKAGEVELRAVGKKSVTVVLGGKPHEIFLPGEEGGAKGEKP